MTGEVEDGPTAEGARGVAGSGDCGLNADRGCSRGGFAGGRELLGCRGGGASAECSIGRGLAATCLGMDGRSSDCGLRPVVALRNVSQGVVVAVARGLGCCAVFQKKAVAAIARMRAQAMASRAVHFCKAAKACLRVCASEAPVWSLPLVISNFPFWAGRAKFRMPLKKKFFVFRIFTLNSRNCSVPFFFVLVWGPLRAELKSLDTLSLC